DGGLAGLAVTNDQLALPATDRRHRVDRLQAGLHRLTDLLAVHHAGGLQLQGTPLVDVGDLTETVDRVAHRVHDTAEVAVADRHRQHVAGALDGGALLDALGVTEHHDTDVPGVEVQCDAEGAV